MEWDTCCLSTVIAPHFGLNIDWLLRVYLECKNPKLENSTESNFIAAFQEKLHLFVCSKICCIHLNKKIVYFFVFLICISEFEIERMAGTRTRTSDMMYAFVFSL